MSAQTVIPVQPLPPLPLHPDIADPQAHPQIHPIVLSIPEMPIPIIEGLPITVGTPPITILPTIEDRQVIQMYSIHAVLLPHIPEVLAPADTPVAVHIQAVAVVVEDQVEAQAEDNEKILLHPCFSSAPVALEWVWTGHV
jgi:hypothetical protein